ncbi:MAG: hypothetical protein LUE98_18915 [Tannerellaceae bacterium]|nr:hypothetical protein [Tannerellaceae bacterium]
MPVWSHIKGTWLEESIRYYNKEKEEEYHQKYEGLYKIIENKERTTISNKYINFSFVEFVSKQLKKVPLFFEIYFRGEDFFCEREQEKLIIHFPEEKIEDFTGKKYKHLKKFKDCLSDKLTLKIEDEIKKEEIFKQFYRFLCAYKNERFFW